MDWAQFRWRKVMGVPTTHVGGRRIELFKELVWRQWRHVPMWGYRISGVDQGGRYKTMRQAKAQAELHARRLRETSVKPATVPEGVVTKPRPKRVPLDPKQWWGIRQNPLSVEAARVLAKYNEDAEEPIRVCVGGSEDFGYDVEVSTEWGVLNFYNGDTLDEALRQFVEEYG